MLPSKNNIIFGASRRIVFLLFACGFALCGLAEQYSPFRTFEGVVKDRKSRKALEYVNITIPGTGIGTVTNAEGAFALKLPDSIHAQAIELSHIGYLNELIPLDGRDMTHLAVQLTPSVNMLDEVVIRGRDPREIVDIAIQKISANYSKQPTLLTGFYRETAQKGQRYINIVEAVAYVYKTPYRDRNPEHDRVQVHKSRRLLSQRVSDTLAVKILGGPNLAVGVDIVKNPDLLLDPQTIDAYDFRMEEAVMLNDRPHYVIRFTPRHILTYALYQGRLFIDKEQLAFTRAEFSLDMSDRNKATEAILRKKPAGLRFSPQEVTFLVTYKTHGEQTCLSYIRNEVRFRCDWKRKLFRTAYTITSEMVITDIQPATEPIAYKDAFRVGNSLSDQAKAFYDPDFWGDYNIIPPTEPLEAAVTRLRRMVEE